jgi:hypothetical protein
MVGNRQLPEYSDLKSCSIIQNLKPRVHRPIFLATESATASPITGFSCRMTFHASYITNGCCGLERNFLALSRVVRRSCSGRQRRCGGNIRHVRPNTVVPSSEPQGLMKESVSGIAGEMSQHDWRLP